MTDRIYPSVPMMQALIFNVACHRIHSRGDQRRFFAQMRRTLAARGYAMSQWHGFCVIVLLHEQELRKERHDVLNWLVDQLETAKVVVHESIPVTDLLIGRFNVLGGREQALEPLPEIVAREFIRYIAAGAVTQALRRLQRSRSHEFQSRQTIPLP